MIHIAIVDDEKQVANYIARTTQMYAQKLDIPVSVTIFQSSTKFLDSYSSGTYDVAFLDIEMPEMNGDELSARLTEIDPSLLLVYVTNYCNDEVYTMLKYMPIGFIRKPLFEQEIGNMLSILKSKIITIQKLYSVQSGKQVHQIPLRDVIFVDSEKNYVYFHVLKHASSKMRDSAQQEEVIKVRKKLDEVQNDIESIGFIRIHSSILVNYRFIYGIHKNAVQLDNGSELMISRSREPEVIKQFLYFSRR